MVKAVYLSLAVTAGSVSIAHAQDFLSPIGGVPYIDWTIVNYVDLDDEDGQIRDWAGGGFTYDGHYGIDYTLPNFAAMDKGVTVHAVAAGLVIAMRDGEFDRWSKVLPFPEDVNGNFVAILHDNGVVTDYWHFKKNSILVRVGDRVAAGQLLGEVGSSGYSTDPHLHFEVTDSNFRAVETYLQPDYWWRDPLPYAGSVPGAMDYGIVASNPTLQEYVDRPVQADVFDLQRGLQFVYFWQALHGFTTGDIGEVKWIDPQGNIEWSSQFEYDEVQFWWTLRTFMLQSTTQTGEWSLRVSANDVDYIDTRFMVVDSSKPGNGRRVLPHGKWQLISLPANLKENESTLAALFAGKLEPGSYGSQNIGYDWIVYKYDSTERAYFEVSLTEPLQPGVGYWFIQTTDEDVTLALPEGSFLVDGQDCRDGLMNCTQMQIQSISGSSSWHMLGKPGFNDFKLGDATVYSDSGVCSGTDGCSLQEANQANVLNEKMFWFNDGAYSEIGQDDTIPTWHGVWALALSSSPSSGLKVEAQ
jgi:murein DD-endopeptidase MepM/ murein hydrolase activator NlpD